MFNEGYRAFQRGEGLDANPYATRKWQDEWEDGWIAAAYEAYCHEED